MYIQILLIIHSYKEYSISPQCLITQTQGAYSCMPTLFALLHSTEEHVYVPGRGVGDATQIPRSFRVEIFHTGRKIVSARSTR